MKDKWTKEEERVSNTVEGNNTLLIKRWRKNAGNAVASKSRKAGSTEPPFKESRQHRTAMPEY